MRIFLLLASLLLSQVTGRPEFGSVSGQIRTPDGSPAATVRVAAVPVDEKGTVNGEASTLATIGLTDSAGRYSLERIPPGRYFIAAGFLSAPSYFPGVSASAQARIVAVTSAQAVTGIDFRLALSGGVRVSGRVTNVPTWAPAGLIRVALTPAGRPTTAPMMEIPTAADGTFIFTNVPPGSYGLLTKAFIGQVRPFLEIADKDVEGIELVSSPMVLGRVTVENGSALAVQGVAVAMGISDPPLPIRVQASRAGSSTTLAAVSPDRDGSFMLTLAPNAKYNISAAQLPLGYYIKSFSHGTVDLLQSTIGLAFESSPQPIELVLTTTPPAGAPKEVKISGRLTGRENIPAGTPVLMSLQSSPGTGGASVRTAEVQVRDDGTFEIARVPPGRYTLRTIPVRARTVNLEVAGADITGLDIAVLP